MSAPHHGRGYRPKKEIDRAVAPLEARVMYERALIKIDLDDPETHNLPHETTLSLADFIEQIEAEYDPEFLGEMTDFEWGILNGQLSALRWVQGWAWNGSLDT